MEREDREEEGGGGRGVREREGEGGEDEEGVCVDGGRKADKGTENSTQIACKYRLERAYCFG